MKNTDKSQKYNMEPPESLILVITLKTGIIQLKKISVGQKETDSSYSLMENGLNCSLLNANVSVCIYN